MHVPDSTTTFRYLLYAWMAWGLVMFTVLLTRWSVVEETHLVGYVNATFTPIAPEDWND